MKNYYLLTYLYKLLCIIFYRLFICLVCKTFILKYVTKALQKMQWSKKKKVQYFHLKCSGIEVECGVERKDSSTRAFVEMMCAYSER